MLQQQILNVVSDLGSIGKGMEALLFSIYGCAVHSMTDEEVQKEFGLEKSLLQTRFLTATQKALANAGLLKTSDLVLLQAFCLYLVRHYLPESGTILRLYAYAVLGLLSFLVRSKDNVVSERYSDQGCATNGPASRWLPFRTLRLRYRDKTSCVVAYYLHGQIHYSVIRIRIPAIAYKRHSLSIERERQ